jgi:hypothetical protein
MLECRLARWPRGGAPRDHQRVRVKLLSLLSNRRRRPLRHNAAAGCCIMTTRPLCQIPRGWIGATTCRNMPWIPFEHCCTLMTSKRPIENWDKLITGVDIRTTAPAAMYARMNFWTAQGQQSGRANSPANGDYVTMIQRNIQERVQTALADTPVVLLKNTPRHRGRDIKDCKRMLYEAGFENLLTSPGKRSGLTDTYPGPREDSKNGLDKADMTLYICHYAIHPKTTGR